MYKILVVDDEQLIRGMLEDEISDRGIEVSEASSVDEALEFFYKDHYDLVITDLNMPEKTGQDLVDEIRNQTHNYFVPVVIISGFAEQAKSDLLRYKDLFFLNKPFDPDDVHLLLNLIFPDKVIRRNNYRVRRQINTILGVASKIFDKHYSIIKRDLRVLHTLEANDAVRPIDKNFLASCHLNMNGKDCQLIYVMDQNVTLELFDEIGEWNLKDNSSEFVIFEKIYAFLKKLHGEITNGVKSLNSTIDIKNLTIMGSQSHDTSILFETDSRFDSVTVSVGHGVVSLIFLQL